jgi:hypothetical protein
VELLQRRQEASQLPGCRLAPREALLSFGFENETSTRSSFSLKRQKI